MTRRRIDPTEARDILTRLPPCSRQAVCMPDRRVAAVRYDAFEAAGPPYGPTASCLAASFWTSTCDSLVIQNDPVRPRS